MVYISAPRTEKAIGCVIFCILMAPLCDSFATFADDTWLGVLIGLMDDICIMLCAFVCGVCSPWTWGLLHFIFLLCFNHPMQDGIMRLFSP